MEDFLREHASSSVYDETAFNALLAAITSMRAEFISDNVRCYVFGRFEIINASCLKIYDTVSKTVIRFKVKDHLVSSATVTVNVDQFEFDYLRLDYTPIDIKYSDIFKQ
jgi:hypothetical protein